MQCRRHDNKAQLVELVVVDMLRVRVVVASGARSSGSMRVDLTRSSGANLAS